MWNTHSDTRLTLNTTCAVMTVRKCSPLSSQSTGRAVSRDLWEHLRHSAHRDVHVGGQRTKTSLIEPNPVYLGALPNQLHYILIQFVNLPIYSRMENHLGLFPGVEHHRWCRFWITCSPPIVLQHVMSVIYCISINHEISGWESWKDTRVLWRWGLSESRTPVCWDSTV